MLSDFLSKGRPRNGQWVWLSNQSGDRWLAIVDCADHGLFKTRQDDRKLAKEIEIIGFPSREEMTENKGKVFGKPGWYSVSVLELGSRDTAFHVLVDGDRLTPIVDRSELPPHIRDNENVMHPGFKPVP